MKNKVIGVIDCDFIAFKVAAASEKSYIVVKHNSSGTSKEFKNKSEFLGRSKKTLGGWLGELNKSRLLKNKREFLPEEFTLETRYEAQPLEKALYAAKNMLKSYKQYMNLSKTILLVGEGKTFRHNLPLPTRYKDSRKDLHKPILLGDVKDYFKNRSNTEIITGIEADDKLSHYMYKGHLFYKKNGWHNFLGIGIDKDNLQTYGKLWNPTKDALDDWMYPEPRVVDGLGEIYRDEKGKVRGYGDIWLFFQIINGDDTDGYNPTKPFGIRSGEVGVYECLKGVKTYSEGLQVLCDVYHEWFPKGVQYTSWNGLEMVLTPTEYMQLHADCAFMQRWDNDRFIIEDEFKKNNIVYDKRS